jgi:hypothetical protein
MSECTIDSIKSNTINQQETLNQENTKLDTDECLSTSVEQNKNDIPITDKEELKDKQPTTQEKLMTLIEKELLSKTEEDIKNMTSKELDKIIGNRTLIALENQAKRMHMGQKRLDEMKCDFIIMLKKSFEGDQKGQELQKELSNIEKKFNEDIKKAMKESEIDIPELVVDLCTTDKYQKLDDKDANLKLYIRGLKRAGNLENISSILSKYKFKTLYNLYKKSFSASSNKVFKMLKNYKSETFNDPRIIAPSLKSIFVNDGYQEDTINIFAFLFYMLFDNIKDNKFSLDFLIFTKYFLTQTFYLISNAPFKSKELFITNIKNILDQIQLKLLTENLNSNQINSFEKDKKEISELKKESDKEVTEQDIINEFASDEVEKNPTECEVVE